MGRPASAVTVVVPVWDSHVRYLAEALASLLVQVPQPRVVVVDNCSAVAVTVPGPVSLVRTPQRLSAGAARSFGLAQVDTEFVIFWDADDLMPAGTVAALEHRIGTDPGLVLVVPRIREADGTPHHWPRPRITAWLAHRPTWFATVSVVSSLVPTVGAVMRTDTVRAAGGFPDRDFGDDWVLGVGLALRGRVALIPHDGRVYRRHRASLSRAHEAPGDRLAHARAVRTRLAGDPAAPRLLRAAVGPLALGQTAVICGLGPLRRSLTRLRRR
jgi:glycosyltransferase involved in cell wall biosynthesis